MNAGRWHKVTEIFHAALAREPASRDAFVADACKDDSVLREDVAKLIAAHDAAGNLGEIPGLPMPPMPRLEPGTLLGLYRVDEWIAAGGMGEVYRAVDTKLARPVALKVLSPGFAQDPERVARFHREAQMLAALNHPHIAHIHGLETIDGVTALVMEMVDGATLADRISNGPIALEEALSIARQLAEALDAAHQHGIAHRDLKPANIKITSEGAVKVLDFGLAKALDASAPIDLANLPAAASPAITRHGVILGTAGYMAPEQARGKRTDKRADIWSFGCVVYEMLTGRPAFSGESLPDTLAAVLEREPDWSQLPDNVPANVRRWLVRCLEKDPKRRVRDIGDVWLDLEQSDAVSLAAARGVRAISRPGPIWMLATVLVSGVVGAALGTWLRWGVSPSPPPLLPVVRFTLPVEPVPTTDFGTYSGLRLAISRDGRRLAYISRRADTTSVFVRELATPPGAVVPGTEGATGVFFSPDGDHVGFFAAGKLKRIAVGGGAARTLCDVVQGGGATWGDDNTIVFAPSPMSVLMRVSSEGGTPAPATQFHNGEVSHRWPEFLPSGSAFVYTASRSNDFSSSKIIVQSLETGDRMELTEGTYPRYASSGHLVFAREASLFALPFDPVRLRPNGPPAPLVADLRMNSETGVGLFAVSGSTLVYRKVSAPFVPRRLVWVDLTGAEDLVPLEPRPFLQPRLSPDGARVAISVGGDRRDRDLWIYDFLHRALTKFTVEAGEEETPVWSPDGGLIAFSTLSPGRRPMIVTRPPEGAGLPTALSSGQYMLHVSDWSSDGRTLAWTEFTPTLGGEIRIGMLDGSGAIRTVVAGPFDERGAVFSPDVRWIAYTSNESGRDEVYVQPYPGPGRRQQVSVGGGQEPAWSRNGDKLYFRGKGGMASVDVKTSPRFTTSTPRKLFDDVYETEHSNSADRNYDVSADGRRFLMVKAARAFPPAELIVVLNWSATLGRQE
jgi:serine/threonine-protein kinase